MVRRLALSLWLAFAAFASSGCTGTDSSTTTVTSTPMIVVSPSTFLGELQCAPNQVHKYVVTLVDLDTGIPLTPVGPHLCTEPAYFAAPPLVIQDRYAGHIDAYDTDDVVRSNL